MRARATTTVTILRTPPDTVDAYGDPTDDHTPVATGVLASILLSNVRQYVRAENRTTTVTTYTGRLLGTTDVRPDDRIKDETTNDIYSIERIGRFPTYAGIADLRLDLKKTT
ncbi:hypothetical protein [Actinomadura nitritigenes]|uniref:hypothetical protein n=1 Tax=Actinomadura nitritigenes TaxID=134602 RepID=UPI003D90213D